MLRHSRIPLLISQEEGLLETGPAGTRMLAFQSPKSAIQITQCVSFSDGWISQLIHSVKVKFPLYLLKIYLKCSLYSSRLWSAANVFSINKEIALLMWGNIISNFISSGCKCIKKPKLEELALLMHLHKIWYLFVCCLLVLHYTVSPTRVQILAFRVS